MTPPPPVRPPRRLWGRVLALSVVVLLLIAWLGRGIMGSWALHRWVAANMHGQLRESALNLDFHGATLKDVVVVNQAGQSILEADEVRVAWNLTGHAWDFLQSVEIIRPHVRLERLEDGRWNMAGLFPSSPGTRTPAWAPHQFSGVAWIQDASIAWTDALRGGYRTTFNHVQGVLDARSGPLQITLGGHQGNSHFSFNGAINDARVAYRLRGVVTGIDVESWGNYALARAPVMAEGGTADVDVSLWGQLDPSGGPQPRPDILAQGEVQHGKCQVLGIPGPLEEVRGRFTAGPGWLELQGVQATLGPSRLSLRGRIYDLARPQVDLTVALGQVEISRILRFFHRRVPYRLHGLVAATVGLKGAAGAPQVAWQVSSPALGFLRQSVQDVAAHGTWDHQTVHLEDSALKSGQGSWRAQGWFFLAPRPVRMCLQLSSHDAPLAPWAALFPALRNFVGTTDVHLTLVGAPSHPVVTGTAGLDHAVIHGVSVGHATTDLAYLDGSLFLSNGQVQTDHGSFSLSTGFMDVARQDYLLWLEAHQWHFPTMQAGIWGQLTGSLNASLGVIGTGGHSPVASGTVSGGDIHLGRLHLTDIHAPIWLDSHIAEFSAGTARYEQMPLYFAGRSLLPPRFAMDLSLYVPDTPLARLQPDLPWKFPFVMAGRGPSWIDVLGGPDDGVSWDVTTAPETGTFLTRGYVAPHDYGFTGFVLGTHADVRRLAPDFAWKYQPEGHANLQVIINGVDNVVDSQYSIQGEPDLRIDGVRVTDGQGGLTARGSYLDVQDNFFSGPTARLEVHGQRTGDTMHLDLAVDNVNLARAWRELDLTRWKVPVHILDPYFDFKTMQGVGLVYGSLDGSVQDPVFTGHVDIPHGAIEGEPFRLGGDVRLTSKVLVTRHTEFVRHHSHLVATGRLLMGHPVGYDMDLSTHDAQAADLLTGLKLPVTVTGRVDGQVHVSGTTDDPRLAGQVTLDRPTVMGQPLTSMVAVFNSASQHLSLQSLHGVLGSGSFDLHGTLGPLGPLGRLNLAFTLQDIALQDLRALDALGQRQGTLSGRGRLAGPNQAVLGQVDLTGRHVELQGHPFDTVQVRTTFSPHSVAVAPLLVQGPGGSLNLTGTVGLPGGPEQPQRAVFDLTGQARDFDVSLLAPILHFDDVRGRLTGHTRVSGTMARPEVVFEARGEHMELAHKAFGSVAAAGVWSRDEMRLDTLSFDNGASTGRVQGVWKRIGGLEGEAHLTNFDTSSLSARFPLSGLLTADAVLGSEGQQPVVHATFNMKQGAVASFRFDTFGGAIDYVGGVLKLVNVQATSPKEQLLVDGTLPVGWKNGQAVSTAPMDIHAQLDQSDLSLLSLFLPQLESTAGSFKGALAATGTMDDVHLQGQAQITDGLLKFKFMTNPVDNIQLTADLSGHRVTLKSLSGRMGDGAFNGGGFAALDKFFHPDLNFFLRGKRLLFDVPRMYNGRADVDVALKGTMGEPTLSGTVALKEGNLLVTEELTGATDDGKSSAAFGIPPVNLDLQLALQDDVYLKFFGSTIRTRGQLTLTGTTPNVRPLGELKAVGGQINLPFLGLFKIDEGKTFFDGTSALPYMDVTAESTISNYQVFLHWEGDLKNPPKKPVTLSSNPPLPESDILNLLQGRPPVAGGPVVAGQINPFNNALANVGNVTLVQPVLQAIGRVFALSDVSLETLTPNLYSVKLARALDREEHFLFTVTRFFGQQGQQGQLYGLEFHPRASFLLRAATGDLGAYNFVIQYSHRY